MNKCEYEYLQDRLTKKINNNPYRHTGCTNYEPGYKKVSWRQKVLFSTILSISERKRSDERTFC